MRTPTLETRRLILRPLTRQDAQEVWKWASDERVNQYMVYPLHRNLKDTLEWLKSEEENAESDTLYDFGFVRKDTGELIGSGGLSFNKTHELWEIGYNFRYDCWKQGFATEAAGEILRFGNQKLGLSRILGRHVKENTASGHVLEKCGFVFTNEGSCEIFTADGKKELVSKEYLLYMPDADPEGIRERSRVELFYDEEYDEWERLERHVPEFEITKRYMDTFIGSDGESKKILDVGGGPGRYSIYLTQKGHEVTLLDLSGKHIRQALEKAKEYGVMLDSSIHGDALRLTEYFYRKEQYDVVLLMGPLYHLLKEEDRKRAIQEALAMLKPGGLLFASFISAYAPIHDYASGLYDPGDIEELLGYLKDGRNREDKDGFTTSYFSTANEARELLGGFGLEELSFAGVENILCGKEALLSRLPEEQKEKWLELCWRLSGDEKLFGMSQHFLYIGKKGESCG